jgi:hypothetical protein
LRHHRNISERISGIILRAGGAYRALHRSGEVFGVSGLAL